MAQNPTIQVSPKTNKEAAANQQSKAVPVGIYYVDCLNTRQKLNILAQTELESAQKIEILLLGTSELSKFANKKTSNKTTTQQIDKKTRFYLQTIFVQEIAAMQQSSSFSSGGNQKSSIDKASEAVTASFAQAKESLRDLMKPISDKIIPPFEKIAKNPLGAPFVVGEYMANAIEKVSPGFMAKLEASFKKLKLDSVQNWPDQITGNIQQLLGNIKNLLCTPLSLLADVYNGLQKLMDSISKFLDNLISEIVNFFIGPGGVLDGIFPIQGLLKFAESVSELLAVANAVGVLANSSRITSITSQIQGYTNVASTVLRNPANLVRSYISRSTPLGNIRNINGIADRIVPPNLKRALDGIQSLCGSNRTGNFGYGLASALGPAKAQAANTILNYFSKQSSMVGSLLNNNPSSTPQQTDSRNYTPRTVIYVSNNKLEVLPVSPAVVVSRETLKVMETKNIKPPGFC